MSVSLRPVWKEESIASDTVELVLHWNHFAVLILWEGTFGHPWKLGHFGFSWDCASSFFFFFNSFLFVFQVEKSNYYRKQKKFNIWNPIHIFFKFLEKTLFDILESAPCWLVLQARAYLWHLIWFSPFSDALLLTAWYDYSIRKSLIFCFISKEWKAFADWTVLLALHKKMWEVN